LIEATTVALILSVLVVPSALAADADTVGLVDPATGVWRLRNGAGGVATFYYGNPGDAPFAGDWDCDGVDTPGLYRQSDGYVYLRNANTQGPADITFFFGNPGDVPLAGDFDGDGCDTMSIYRPSEGRIYVINELGDDDAGLGAADYSYYFGNPGEIPFTGDFNDDGIDSVGLHRQSTGFTYLRLTNTQVHRRPAVPLRRPGGPLRGRRLERRRRRHPRRLPAPEHHLLPQELEYTGECGRVVRFR
jgi:hypothetical protein